MQVAVKSTATCFFFAAILIGVLFLLFGGKPIECYIRLCQNVLYDIGL